MANHSVHQLHQQHQIIYHETQYGSCDKIEMKQENSKSKLVKYQCMNGLPNQNGHYFNKVLHMDLHQWKILNIFLLNLLRDIINSDENHNDNNNNNTTSELEHMKIDDEFSNLIKMETMIKVLDFCVERNKWHVFLCAMLFTIAFYCNCHFLVTVYVR